MKRALLIAALLLAAHGAPAQGYIPASRAEDTGGCMSPEYWEQWNPAEQARIDRDIERHRKADGEVTLSDIAAGSEVRIEQISHDFVFGAHIFNFEQLGKRSTTTATKSLRHALQLRHRSLLLEDPRTRTRSAALRRRVPGQRGVLERTAAPLGTAALAAAGHRPRGRLLQEPGIRTHGHVLIWGNRRWHHPEWLPDFMTPEERVRWDGFFTPDGRLTDEYPRMGLDELERTFARYADTLEYLYDKRIRDIAARYGERIDSWDVVNESATDEEGESSSPAAGSARAATG